MEIDLQPDAEPSEDAISRIVEIVSERGGLEYARTRAHEYAERAEAALSELEGGSAVDALRAAVAYATRRTH